MAGDHRQRQQQSSPPTRYAAVSTDRRVKANVKQLHHASVGKSASNKRRKDVGWRPVESRGQNDGRGQGQGHHDKRRNKSPNLGNQKNKKDGRDKDDDDSVEQPDVDDGNKVDGVAVDTAETSSSSSSSSSPADNATTKCSPHIVRWIGSAPINDQLRGKQRLDTIIELAGKLSSAVEHLRHVSSTSLCSENWERGAAGARHRGPEVPGGGGIAKKMLTPLCL